MYSYISSSSNWGTTQRYEKRWFYYGEYKYLLEQTCRGSGRILLNDYCTDRFYIFGAINNRLTVMGGLKKYIYILVAQYCIVFLTGKSQVSGSLVSYIVGIGGGVAGGLGYGAAQENMAA